MTYTFIVLNKTRIYKLQFRFGHNVYKHFERDSLNKIGYSLSKSGRNPSGILGCTKDQLPPLIIFSGPSVGGGKKIEVKI